MLRVREDLCAKIGARVQEMFASIMSKLHQADSTAEKNIRRFLQPHRLLTTVSQPVIRFQEFNLKGWLSY